ncbi:hypothetical protein ACOSP7_003128 [Xanthoceras sorbifolium]
MPHNSACFKVKFDVAFSLVEKLLGTKVVIRDRCRAVMLSSIKRVEGCCSPEVAEARAILHGIKLASEVGILPPIVESDSSIVINLILSRSSIRAKICFILDDIFGSSAFFWFY